MTSWADEMSGLLDDPGAVLVIAPHPDDEVLGCGGTIARLADAGREVHVAIVTRGQPPRFAIEGLADLRAEAARAHHTLAVAHTHFLDMPAAELDRIMHADLNHAIAGLFATVAPATIFIPFVGDVHLDHELVFRSAMVAARPNRPGCPRRIYAYETLSETNWNAPYLTPHFTPNVHVDIEAALDRKIAAFAAYRSQCRDFPNERSLDALRALAALRGAAVNRAAAEAFVLIREIV